jgi:hypothetical protein
VAEPQLLTKERTVLPVPTILRLSRTILRLSRKEMAQLKLLAEGEHCPPPLSSGSIRRRPAPGLASRVTTVCPVILRLYWELATKLQLLARAENCLPYHPQLFSEEVAQPQLLTKGENCPPLTSSGSPERRWPSSSCWQKVRTVLSHYPQAP